MNHFFPAHKASRKAGSRKNFLPMTAAFAFLFVFQLTNAQPGTGASNSETRDISGFTSISLDIHADVYLSEDKNFMVQIDAKPDDLSQILTEKDGDRLVIKNKNKWSSKGENTVKITIHLPRLNAMVVNGSGNVVAQTDFSTNQMKLEVNGSGSLKMMSVSADRLKVAINGSGDIGPVKGTIGEVNLEVNGSGNINTESLTGKSVSASIAGSGDITIGVTEKLDAEISGSGSIYYRGNPSTVQRNVTGSGRVTQR